MSEKPEQVVLWRSTGSVPSWLPGSYYSLCVTNHRILILKLGGPDGLGIDTPFLIFGGFALLFGYRIGKAQAQKDAEHLRQLPPDEMLRHCPGSLVIPLTRLKDVEVVGRRLILTGYDRRAVYQFEGLNGAHGRQIRDLMFAARE